MRRRTLKSRGASPRVLDDPSAVRLAALKLLNRRDYAAQELVAGLVDRGAPPGLAADVVAALRGERLVDDSRFAEHFVAAHAGRGQGPLRIAQDLRERGVAEPVAAAAVDASDTSWAERCRQLRRRRFGDAVPSDYAERMRQARFLTYRGFSGEQVRAALGTEIGLDE